MIRSKAAVAGAVFGCLAACSAFSSDDAKPTDLGSVDDGGGADGSRPVEGAPVAQIQLSLDLVGQLEVLRGASASVRVTVKRLNDSSGEVLVSVGGLPKGVHADAVSIPSGESAGSLKVVADDTSAQGVTGASVTGAYSTAKTLLSSPVALSVLVRGKPGTLDETFGTQGIREASALEGLALVDASEQPDGKIVFLARASAEPSIRLGRLTTDGTIDSTFGTAGLVSSTLGGDVGSLSPPLSLVVEPKGEIFVAGDAIGVDGKVAIRHFTAAGAVDGAFGAAGLSFVAPPFPGFHVAAMRQADTGKLVIVGSGTKASAQVIASSRMGIGRLERAGALDPAFGTAGWAIVDRSAFSGATKIEATGLALTKDFVDAMVIASEGPPSDLRGGAALVRFDSNASVAPKATRTDVFGVTFGGLGNAICERANGAGPILGFSTDGVLRLFAFASNGVSRDGFDQDTLSAGNTGNIAVDALGRAIYPVNGAGVPRLAVRRNLPTGADDKTFGTAGLAQTPAGAATVVVSVVALNQRDGRVLVGGHRQVVGDNGLSFARFWP